MAARSSPAEEFALFLALVSFVSRVDFHHPNVAYTWTLERRHFELQIDHARVANEAHTQMQPNEMVN